MSSSSSSSSSSGFVDLISGAAAASALMLIPLETKVRLGASIVNAFRRLFITNFTVVIPEKERLRFNHMYDACSVYLSTKISDRTRAVNVNKPDPDGEELAVTVSTDQIIRDVHGNITFTWIPVDHNDGYEHDFRGFQLSVHKIHRDYALKIYLPYVCRKAKQIRANMKASVRLHTVDSSGNRWTAAVVNHPATMGTMAMDPAVKEDLVRDLDLFVKGKDYYRRVGRAWKRGYLFYGPPGTGKSSLIAAMANYLKFDIFDLDLKAVKSNSHLRNLLLSASNRSILVIEDIDCSVCSLNRADDLHRGSTSTIADDDKITLSGLLNLIDGLWSCYGEERIIVFTTNHRERLDPALLRPGRMDVQLEMPYCTFPALKMLASNYLSVNAHPLFPEIEDLLSRSPATPAQIAGELMKNHRDVDAALNSVVRLLRDDRGITHNI